MNRRTRLQAKTRLERRTPLRGGSQLKQAKPIRQQSKKRQAENRQRRKVVQASFGDQPMCVVPACNRWADDVHEPLTRARGGSITDPANMAPLCRPHHNEITFTEPAWAYEIKLLVHSWEAAI